MTSHNYLVDLISVILDFSCLLAVHLSTMIMLTPSYNASSKMYNCQLPGNSMSLFLSKPKPPLRVINHSVQKSTNTLAGVFSFLSVFIQ